MKLVEFPEVNSIIAKDQPQYRPMPAHRVAHDREGRLICCWELTAEEIAEVGRTGKIWQQVLTFNQPLQPQLLSVEKPNISPSPAPKELHPAHRRARCIAIIAGNYVQARNCANERRLRSVGWFFVDSYVHLLGYRASGVVVWLYGTARERDDYERLVQTCRAKQLTLIDAPAFNVGPPAEKASG